MVIIPCERGKQDMMDADSAVDTLLAAAVLAPSGDNTQPWRFIVDREAGRIALDVDDSRDPSPMNAAGCMSRISLGAVLENIVRTAKHNAWDYEIEESPEQGLVGFRLLSTQSEGGSVDPLLKARVTNRRIYDGKPLDPDCLDRLKRGTALASESSAKTELIADPKLIAELIGLIGRGDALILGIKNIRNAFLEKVRFDAPPDEEVAEGLSLGSLEISAMDRMALRLLRTLSPPDGLMKFLGARRMFTRVATQLASSASAICLITTTEQGELADINVGRAWQSIWLQLAEEKLAAQPMMSLIVLQNIIDNGDRSLLKGADLDASQAVLEEFNTATKRIIPGQAAAMMRIGHAPAPSARVGRLRPLKLTVQHG